MNDQIKQAFDKVFGDMCLSDNDVALHIFELGYRAGAAAENEACAKLTEESYSKQIIHYPKGYYVDPNKLGEYSKEIASRCAAAIRQRGTK